jgi:isopenicillin N synthase-like dioxygenase
MSVPIIDMSSSISGDDAARRALAAEIDRACRDIGFFTIVRHGIDEALIERVKDFSASFFALPAAEKSKYKGAPGVKGIRGYRGVGDESLSYSLSRAAPPDYKETFRVGRVDVPDDAITAPISTDILRPIPGRSSRRGSVRHGKLIIAPWRNCPRA